MKKIITPFVIGCAMLGQLYAAPDAQAWRNIVNGIKKVSSDQKAMDRIITQVTPDMVNVCVAYTKALKPYVNESQKRTICELLTKISSTLATTKSMDTLFPLIQQEINSVNENFGNIAECVKQNQKNFYALASKHVVPLIEKISVTYEQECNVYLDKKQKETLHAFSKNLIEFIKIIIQNAHVQITDEATQQKARTCMVRFMEPYAQYLQPALRTMSIQVSPEICVKVIRECIDAIYTELA